MSLRACEDGRDDENGPHVLLAREAGFVAALVSLAREPGDLGDASMTIIARLALPVANRLPLLRAPGLPDALLASPHVAEALAAFSRLAEVTNAALVERLVANVSRGVSARVALTWLCVLDNNRALLNPGLAAAESALTSAATSVLIQMTLSDPLGAPTLSNPLVLDALLRATGSGIDGVASCAIIGLSNWSVGLGSENDALTRIVHALVARVDNKFSEAPLLRLCYIGDLPVPHPAFDLSLLCSRPFRNQLSLCKAVIRERPEQLSVQDSSGCSPLNLARAAHLPASIICLVRDCAVASLAEYSLAHLVGYTRPQLALARAQRLALMCCLVRLTDEPARPAAEDERGALNPGKAVQCYRRGGKDPWSVIGRFAF
jgi:hypothetical protein